MLPDTEQKNGRRDYTHDRVMHWRRMAEAFEEMAERRAAQIRNLQTALDLANKRLASLGVDGPDGSIFEPSDDLSGDLFSARLLIQNLRRQLRERPPARQVA